MELDDAIVARLRAAAGGRRGSDFIRVVQQMVPGAGRLGVAAYFRQAVPTAPLQALKQCGEWQGFGGSMSDAAVDAELAPFMPAEPFEPTPCPEPWTAGAPVALSLPEALTALLDDTPRDRGAWQVCGDWLERQASPWAAAVRAALPWADVLVADAFGLRAEIERMPHVLRFRWVPPGRFRMGEAQVVDAPLRTVTLRRGFWMAERPVPQGLWLALTGDNQSWFAAPDKPVHGISWRQAEAFCARLGARLPTEAEWECACRAGTATQTWRGDLGGRRRAVLDPIAWFLENCADGFEGAGYDIRPVGQRRGGTPIYGGVRRCRQKAPNPLGLYDMLGNVSEWCADRYAQYPGNGVDPVGPAEGERRVHRGGSWSWHWTTAGRRDFDWPDVTRRDGWIATSVRPVF